MPKKTQQKRRHSKKQKRTLKRNVKRTMRGGDAIVHYRQISPMGSSPVYSENVNSVNDWIKSHGENYKGYNIENGLTIHKIWQNMG